ncbi:MAG: hypothetical protein GY866_41090 [Proteobacteria bacterium]|nr:hypothetical protein [Pseudomonadota bacterium]
MTNNRGMRNEYGTFNLMTDHPMNKSNLNKMFHNTNGMQQIKHVLIIISFLTLAACQRSSGDDEGGGGTTPVTPTAPTVVSTSPADSATGVGISSSITATFSTDMSGSTITPSSFTVSDGSSDISGLVNYSDTVATFIPSTSLQYTSTYTATLTTAIQNESGTAMASSYSWNFTTEGGNVTVLEIAAGDEHTCALLDNGTVKCWGNNEYGQLGIGSEENKGTSSAEMGNNLTAIDLGTQKYALQVVTGRDHSCARLDDGSVKCWGRNDYGQLGQESSINIGDSTGEMGDKLGSINLGTGRTAVEISAGENHTCARLDNATIRCWGRNEFGQLGQDSTSDIGDETDEMKNLSSIQFGTNYKAVEVEAGWHHTCARLIDTGPNTSLVKCWGNNQFGQLGIDHTDASGDASNDMQNLDTTSLLVGRKAVELAAGFRHTCARLDNGYVECWGQNNIGQLGIGNTQVIGDATTDALGTTSDATTDLGSNRTAVQIEARHEHTCALLDNGTVKCWGNNLFGQLGQRVDDPIGDSSSDMANLKEIDIGTGRTALSIAVGSNHTCVKLDTGLIKCWGFNTYGQLGIGNKLNHGTDTTDMGDNLPTINLGTGAFAAVRIDVGERHSCAHLGYSSVKCWGANEFGQLGQDSTNDIGNEPNEMGNSLPAISLGGNVVELAVGKNHSCARLDEGSVKCWGDNRYGQLGIGNTTTKGDASGDMASLSPLNFGLNKKALEIAAGGYHTCARLDDRTVKCWGSNEYGQLGLGHENNIGDDGSDTLSAVSLGAETPVQIAAGENFTCARLDNGTVKCWGSNSNGQLGLSNLEENIGDDSTDTINAITGLGGTVLQIVAGFAHTCALLDDSSVKCWGENKEYGILGQENIEPNILVSDLTGSISSDDNNERTVRQISAGRYHNCAILDNSIVKCWGQNFFGQLGLGHTTHKGWKTEDMGDDLANVELGTQGDKAIELSAGKWHTCARLVNGRVKCWGNNQYGQLGLGDNYERGDDATGDMGDNLPYVILRSQ